ncbi:hypothetical protein THICB1_140045 [Thiomonas arsenitoxydans]|uniref:Uncharacterized protein n=1 Tax=Thiomonas arsenitoxydans (strain DSM 22701 / CIP 110005 / 3As) TaxID=426114 RepID=A0ABP1Z0W9_THIA3|nr:hypothetical protein THICB6_150048 [Thiomonas arsenitoxydans]CQR30267.1 hypothetical protein THICB1_140045 [Thiomonas arsenitoxydans]CQR41144.1 hypothetical protein ACO3_80011 [Thiomonas arsenitoxydans]
MLQPANCSISRLSSTKGNPRSSASICPRVDLPAPRSPMRATRELRPALSPPVPSISPTAARTRCRVASSRCSSSSRSSSHSGEEVVTSPINSARLHCSAWATCSRTRMDAFPTPLSRLARWRSETSEAMATALRVRPRRARRARTRSPSAIRKGWRASPWVARAAASSGDPSRGSCNILLDISEIGFYSFNAQYCTFGVATSRVVKEATDGSCRSASTDCQDHRAHLRPAARY